MLTEIPIWLVNVFSPVNRWVHIVGSTLLVGGVLFFEFVVPLATEDLPEGQRMAVFGRARWVFRRVVVASILMLLVTGCISAWRMWHIYSADRRDVGAAYTSIPWAAGHAILGLIGFLLAMRATRTNRLSSRPLQLLRTLLMVLLVTMFLASVARHVRLRLRDMSAPSTDEQATPGGTF